MDRLRNLVVALSLALPWNITAQQIADVFSISKDSVSSVDDSSVNSVENKKVSFDGSIEPQSRLYDNFTFEEYSEKPWVKFFISALIPLTKNTNISLSESLYYTPEKNNPTSENNITDLMLSRNLSDKFSADVWLEYSYYIKQKDADMLSVFLMLNYSPNDKITFTTVPYKPLLLDWKKISDFYLLNKYTYKTLSNVEFWVNTVTSCTDNWKTKVWFTLNSPIWDNLSLGFSTIPKELNSWNVSILPKWAQWTLSYSF